MKFTGNLGLKKPEGTDVVNIDDLNQNFDILDVEVVKVASPTQNGRMSAADKAKLDGIEAGAQRNTVTSVNNKTGAVILTASDVGASPTGHTHTFAEITSKPTTLAGYGITDAIPTSQKGAANGVASLDASTKVPTSQLHSASTSVAGIVQLNNDINSTSTTQAATANAVKQAYDKAIQAETNAKSYTDQQLAAHLADYVKHPADGGTTGGTATAYTCSSNPAPTALVDKIGVVITAHVDSGANPTLNWNNLGAKPIKKPNGNAAILKAGGIYTLRYSAVSGNFIVQGEGASGNATASDLLSGKTASTDAGDIVGTMPNKVGSGTIITPSTSDIAIPQGYYGGVLADGKVKGDANLIAENIKKDVSIFGVIGSLTSEKKATGTVTSYYDSRLGRCIVSRSGLSFPVKTVLLSNSAPNRLYAFSDDYVPMAMGFDNMYNVSSTTLYKSLSNGSFTVEVLGNSGITFNFIAIG